MKKLSLRDINMILVVVGLVILVATYFLVYRNFTQKNAELTATIAERQAHLEELQGYYANLKTYEKGTAEGKANIKANLDRLPLGIQSEDFLMYIMDSTNEVNADLRSVNFNDEAEISKFSTVIDNHKKECTGYQVKASFTASMNYEQLKDYLDYVYNRSDKITFIDTFIVSYNAGDAVLDTSFALSKYFITYDGSQYIPVPVPDVSLGVDNPFHTS